MISVQDYLFFLDEELDGMVRIITALGDNLANQRPDIPGSNSPYAILTHCLGVMAYWGGYMIAGRNVERDRDAEFRASGPVRDLLNRTDQARQQFRSDLSNFEPAAPPRGVPNPAFVPGGKSDADLPLGRTQGGALIHLYSELAQHRGQMESSRDVLLAPWGRLTREPNAAPQPDNRYQST
jgi:hypothetical protein